MNYIHHPYPFPGHAGVPLEQPMAFDPAMAPPSMVQSMDGYFYPQPPFDMMDFYHQPIMDYEEYTENLSRPRLTKEQVETLEAQFQAHPKPSSNVKRQLAAQTNLSLPRVANWFQNRRAKAKQQKRQEEFERMQKAKVEAEEAARAKSDSTDPPADSKTPTGEAEKSTSTPKQEDAQETASTGEHTKTSSSTAPSSSRSKHLKTKSQSAREATFASLQRALNAAATARGHHNGDDEVIQPNTNDLEESVSPTTTSNSATAFPATKGNSSNRSSGANQPLPEWESSRDSSITWSRGSQEPYSSQRPDSSQMQFHQGEEWMHRASNDAGTNYSPMQYRMQHPMQQPDASLGRRTSSEELANHLEGIGIHTTIPSSHAMPLLTHRADKASWKDAGKELDLAARRKRPRPAAIGTSKSSSMLSAAANMSPNTRANYGSGAQGIRQSKSAQSLNSRYAGVRKASAAQRSPLNFSTFADASSKADMSSMLRPTVTTTALAPPTPLTPEDMQHLLPTSPSDSYCLSAQPSAQFFPTTQPMQINVASPPATPMTMDMMSSYPYQNAAAAPPMSAPPHYTSFPEYPQVENAPLTAPARSWSDAPPTIPSPEVSYHPPLQQPAEVSPISYDPTVEAGEHGKASGMSPSLGAMTGDGKFMIQEFPEQQEAHRFVAQQLPHAKHYTFTNNQTPNDF